VRKLLLIGPLTNRENPSKTGGTVVLFVHLHQEFRERNIDFDVIDSLKENYPHPAVAFISVMFQLIKRIRHYEVISLQATNNGLVFIGPAMIFLSKAFHKKANIRKFAGDFHEVHRNAGFVKRKLIEYVFKKSDANFFQTKYLVEYFARFNKNTFLFPNARPRILTPDLPRSFRRRFVFVGTVNQEKGIDEIVDIAGRLPEGYVLDVYGPIIDAKYSKPYFEKYNVPYKGALEAEKVLPTLNAYDVLVLPTYYKGEGYPGVIIEAFSLGIPVIATGLKGIREMVRHDENGILIEPKNSDLLYDAMLAINDDLYQTLSMNAYRSFDQYDAKIQTDIFLRQTGILP
jgi:glycosyltransferase involved in cell wall biosynthesis